MTLASGTIRNQRSTRVERRSVAVFELDGTIIQRDSLAPFLATFAWRHRRKMRLPMIPAVLSLNASRMWSEQKAKQSLLTSILGGYSAATIQAHAEWFCQNWVSSHLVEQTVHRLRQHQANGDRVILLTASPSVYVPTIANFLGIDEVICTQVAFECDRCTGRIIGENCKGSVKLEALKMYLGDDDARLTFGYGDSESDVELLRWTRFGAVVSRNRLVAIN